MKIKKILEKASIVLAFLALGIIILSLYVFGEKNNVPENIKSIVAWAILFSVIYIFGYIVFSLSLIGRENTKESIASSEEEVIELMGSNPSIQRVVLFTQVKGTWVWNPIEISYMGYSYSSLEEYSEGEDISFSESPYWIKKAFEKLFPIIKVEIEEKIRYTS